MKPPAFDYLRPAAVDEALSMLAGADDGVRVLAGGQSLIPLMNFRVALPDRLVDINFIDELRYIRADGGELAIGAGVRQAEAERSADVVRLLPELVQTLRSVAHLPVRNRGTVVGSIAHADPAAELPALLLALDGSVVARSASGERRIGAAELFAGPLVTTLAPGELIVEGAFPARCLRRWSRAGRVLPAPRRLRGRRHRRHAAAAERNAGAGSDFVVRGAGHAGPRRGGRADPGR